MAPVMGRAPARRATLGALADLRASAVASVRRFHALAKRTLEEGWESGRLLTKLKAATPHGEWLSWLAEHGISPRLAQRLMRLYREYPQKRHLVAFAGVSEALRDRAAIRMQIAAIERSVAAREQQVKLGTLMIRQCQLRLAGGTWNEALFQRRREESAECAGKAEAAMDAYLLAGGEDPLLLPAQT